MTERIPTFQDAAAWALARGLAVFPLAERSKNPLAGSHGHKDATLDAGKVADMAQGLAYSNVGIRCGAMSNLFVLDVDMRAPEGDRPGVDGLDTLTAYELEYGDLPATLTIRTGGGGLQYYFRHIEGAGNKVGFADGLDTRAEGGYVVGPGSIHPSGEPYSVELDAPIAEAPAWLIELVRKPKVDRPAPAPTTPEAIEAIPLSRREAYVRSVIARQTSDLAAMLPDSGRNDALNRGAFKIGTALHFAPGLRADAEAALLDACHKNGLAGGRGDEARCNKTIQSGLSGGLSHPRPWPIRQDALSGAAILAAAGLIGPRPADAAGKPSNAAPGRPVIDYQPSALDLPTVGCEAAAALTAQGFTYNQAGVISQLVPMAGWSFVARPYTALTLMGELARCAIWSTVKTNTRGEKVAHIIKPPDPVTNYVLGTPPKILNLPELAGITSSPVMRADGSITTTPGYDAPSGMYYSRPPGFTMADVPATPSREDVAIAREILEELFIDFPFEDDASRANTYAAMLSLVGRRLYTGSTPMFLVTAPQQGNGKTLLVKGLILAATGAMPSVLTVSDDRAEFNKALTTELMSGGEAALFDNLTGNLENPDLAALVTGERWKARLLGGNTQVTLDVNKVFFVTGNNVRVGGDMVRRVVPISLDAGVSYAYKRKGWKHPDFLAYIRSERGAIIWSLMVILRYWVNSGRPDGGHTVGSFEPWAHMTGGALTLAGCDGFLGNLTQFEEKADSETGQWEAFLLAIRDQFGALNCSCGEIFDRFTDANRRLEEFVPDKLQPYLQPHSKGSFTRMLGKAFSAIIKKRHGASGARVMVWHNPHTKVNEWRVITNDDETTLAGPKAAVDTQGAQQARHSLYD
jgi:hypothetical protein